MSTWQEMLRLSHEPFYGNTLGQWASAAGVALALFFLLHAVRSILAARLQGSAGERLGEHRAAVIALVQATQVWFLLAIALFAGTLILDLPYKAGSAIRSLTIVALLLQGALWGSAFLNLFIARTVAERLAKDAASATTITMLGFIGRIALWTAVALLILQNTGVDVTALVAGLGIGGIAVALAAQNILGDLFASLSIVLDKPFVLGDFIIVGDDMGTVEKIGLKTTRVRSLSGEQLIFANADLLKSRIRNCKRQDQRRVAFTIAAAYDTPPDKLQQIPVILRGAIEPHADLRFDRSHLKDLGQTGLNFETVYFVLSPDYNLYMNHQQRINLHVLERFKAEGIGFAWPLQTCNANRPS